MLLKGQVTTKYYRFLAKDGGWVWMPQSQSQLFTRCFVVSVLLKGQVTTRYDRFLAKEGGWVWMH